MNSKIIISGAAENNLKKVSLEIPHYRLIVVAGVSGSGKSSLVYDVICREGQRLFLENFISESRNPGKKLRKPKADRISGLFPVIAVNQQIALRNPRSTVGTLTEIHDYLRLLFARLGAAPGAAARPERSLFSFNSPSGCCPHCKGLGVEDRIDPALIIGDASKTLREGASVLSTPNGYIIYSQVTMDVLDQVCRAEGFTVDIPWKDLSEYQKNVVLYGSDKIAIPFGKHTLESRMRWTGMTARPRQEGRYRGIIPIMDEILKRDRNPNILRFVRSFVCPQCLGKRLNNEALAYKLWGLNIAEFSALSLKQLQFFFERLSLEGKEAAVAEPVRELILRRGRILARLGLGYLTLERESTTLSGGEAQRIRLANQAVTGLRNVLYVLDEPSAGLHPADHQRLLELMRSLVENGNTVIAVEHDEQTIRASDWIIDLGPGPGSAGGEALFSGPYEEFVRSDIPRSLTLGFLKGMEKFDYAPEIPGHKMHKEGLKDADTFGVENAAKNNLKGLNVRFSAGCFNVIAGISGSGKSSLVEELLEQITDKKDPGLNPFKRIVHIDQSPIGRTPNSNPSTYTGMSDHIRDLFAELPQSKRRGYKKGRFSFVVKGGRCEACGGAGVQQVGMHFLGNIDVPCEVCDGKRFTKETLEILWNGKSIADILELPVVEANEFFKGLHKITRVTQIMIDLGLGYLKLGQPSTTLSGGEAQRVKLATELSKTSSGNILYILDEPTTGLHLADVRVLIAALRKLTEKGHTILAVEHHQDFILSADRIIDLGPGSGDEGGNLVFSGTPYSLMECEASVTGRELKRHISGKTNGVCCSKALPEAAERKAAAPLTLRGITTNNLKGFDLSVAPRSITAVTGVSGSGKSSLVFDTFYAESQRRFSDGLSSYIRQFIGKTGNPLVESVQGLTPAVAVRRKAPLANPRSTVGTYTGLYDLLRLLYSRAGKYPAGMEPLLSAAFSFNSEEGACLVCGGMGYVTACDPEKLVTHPELSLPAGALNGNKTGKFYGEPNGQYVASLLAAGALAGIDFSRPWNKLSSGEKQIAMRGLHGHALEVNWSYKRGNREGVHTFKGQWKGFAALVEEEYARKHADYRGEAMLALMKHNNCPSCNGKRLKEHPLLVTLAGLDIAALSQLEVSEMVSFFKEKAATDGYLLEALKKAVLNSLTAEILIKLESLTQAGLDYLAPARLISTLSGGEFQRLQIAAQIHSGLTGITYMLDEPSFGLHASDAARMGGIVKGLREGGNTVIMVEQSSAMLAVSDRVIELGPAGGREGGKIIADGKPEAFISAKEHAAFNGKGKRLLRPGLEIRGAFANNLARVDVDIPGGGLIAVTGVSGSGKTSLVSEVLHASWLKKSPVNCVEFRVVGAIDHLVMVEQDIPAVSYSGIPATFLGIFEPLRDMFADCEAAKKNKWKAGHFSFLSKDGRCPDCNGSGFHEISMDYWTDARVLCETCHGSRYKPEIQEARIAGVSIPELLKTSFGGLRVFLEEHLKGKNRENILRIVALAEKTGLDYLSVGQPMSTLSAGELQRLKLAAGIAEGKGKNTLYLLDEPTGGLHYKDICKLLALFEEIIGEGGSILCVTHEPMLARAADRIIEIGPGAGKNGGRVICAKNSG
ncbi:MAG TPA: excinuclease ABC subunit A [Elusimicrobia bacterium]|nr:excinuclease ABC subunit A [Elusimicrobiota bacterium]